MNRCLKVGILLMSLCLGIVGLRTAFRIWALSGEAMSKEMILEKSNEIIYRVDIFQGNLKIDDFGKIDNKEKLWLMLINSDTFFSKNIEEVETKEIESSLRKIFGRSFKLEFEDIYSPDYDFEPIYRYDYKKRKYTSNLGMGIDKVRMLKSEVLDVKKEGSYYIVTHRPLLVLDFRCEDEITLLNARLEDIAVYKQNDNSSICNEFDLSRGEIDMLYNRYIEEMSIIEYKFGISKGELYLKGYEIK